MVKALRGEAEKMAPLHPITSVLPSSLNDNRHDQDPDMINLLLDKCRTSRFCPRYFPGNFSTLSFISKDGDYSDFDL